MMHDAKKSDAGIVAMKAANNGAQARAEPPERRAVDQVRRAENKRLRAAGDERLSGTKYDWLRHPASFSEDGAGVGLEEATARGFRNQQNFINASCFHCGGLDMAPGH